MCKFLEFIMLYVMENLFMNSTFLEYQSKCYLPVCKRLLLTYISNLHKISHFSMQNCDLKIALCIKFIHLCAFKYELD